MSIHLFITCFLPAAIRPPCVLTMTMYYSGKSYAVFNLKWLYFWSLTMFAAGSALCGAAPVMDALIVGRVWAGAGGAGIYLGYDSTTTLHSLHTPTPTTLACFHLSREYTQAHHGQQEYQYAPALDNTQRAKRLHGSGYPRLWHRRYSRPCSGRRTS